MHILVLAVAAWLAVYLLRRHFRSKSTSRIPGAPEDRKSGRPNAENRPERPARFRTSPSASSLCPACGHPFLLGAKYCDNCAAPLESDVAPRATFSDSAKYVSGVVVADLDGQDPKEVEALFGPPPTLRISPQGDTARFVDIIVPKTKYRRVKLSVKIGDEVEVKGGYRRDGRFSARFIKNKRTGVVVFGRQSMFSKG